MRPDPEPGPKRVRVPCALCAATAALMLLGMTEPALAAGPQVSETPLPETAVVFTGGPNRVLWGLRLLEDGKIKRLLISGISEEDFLRDFRLSRKLAEARQDGRLVLGTRAQSTLENGAETACWLQQEGLSGPVLLISSDFHLDRAKEALVMAAPGLAVTTLGVKDPADASNPEKAASEARKLTMTRALRFLPQSLALRDGFADCSVMQFR
jgi:uncharacterized SAM-binding protein YcdF (DUF218 family)